MARGRCGWAWGRCVSRDSDRPGGSTSGEPGSRGAPTATWATSSTGADPLTTGDAVRPLRGAPLQPKIDVERFEDRGLIGRGAMGEVRLVRDRVLGRELARKELRADLVGSESLLARFHREARITARLQHPGMVPVHDVGLLPDGRPSYMMREVRGETLERLIDALHGRTAGIERPSLRRVVDIVLRAAETVAYAHSRGVIHRDLKPANLMVGDFGAVVVLDWGLARDEHGDDHEHEQAWSSSSAETQAGWVLGTPAYMPPEQAAGLLDQVGPRSDVYALGALLYQALSGEPPYRGSSGAVVAEVLAGPPPPLLSRRPPDGAALDMELVQLCERAMARDPAERFADAGELAGALTAWLDGVQRRERARAVVSEASALAREHTAHQTQAAQLRTAAAAQLAELPTWAPAEQKRVGWALEAQAAEAQREATLAGVHYVQALHGALQLDPELAEAHAALADWYWQRHQEAELARDVEASLRLEALLQDHDRGRHAAYLAGHGRLSLHTDPPGAEAVAWPEVLHDRRLVSGPAVALGVTPLDEVHLPAGSYLIELRAPGRAAARCPVVVTRDASWDGVAPGGTAPEPVRLLEPTAFGPDDLYVPAGWARLGGDDEATDGLPALRAWVDGFVLRRFPVTHAEYLEFLNDLVAAGEVEVAERHAPGDELEGVSTEQAAYGRDEAGRFTLSNEPVEIAWAPDGPVTLVSWHGACAYASWLAARTGLPWRLPHSAEWEKAARGVDGRLLPWGDHQEPTWAATLGARPGPPLVTSVSAFPEDVGPYGMRGAVGNVRDWCLDSYARAGPRLQGGKLLLGTEDESPYRVLKGGTVRSAGGNVRLAARFASTPVERFAVVGFRLARSV